MASTGQASQSGGEDGCSEHTPQPSGIQHQWSSVDPFAVAATRSGMTTPSSQIGSETGPRSPDATDRVFPIRSVINIDTASSSHSSTREEPIWSAASSQTSEVNSSVAATAGSYLSINNAGSRLGDNGTALSFIQAREAQDGEDEKPPFITARFEHKLTEDGHMVVTGIEGAEKMQRCEDEPINMPGAVQAFGALVAVQELDTGNFLVRIASENSRQILGYSPKELFALNDFLEIFSEEQAENLIDHIDYIREDFDREQPEPEVFSVNVIGPNATEIKLWCAVYTTEKNPGLVICEFELENDPIYPLESEDSLDGPEDTLHSNPTAEEYEESTNSISRPLRVMRNARRSRGEASAMSVYKITGQIQDQLSMAKDLDTLLKITVGVIKELSRFHRVMIYRFDEAWNGKVVTELVDPRATKDLYKGLHFPASDIPKQARELYKINKVRLLYDRDLPTARLVCRTSEDLQIPLDMTHSYLRAMSPIHIQYLENMGVRASMSISITLFGELWGLISCHSYGRKGMRVSFPTRKLCRMVGEATSRAVERLSYASKLQARKLINTVPTEQVPSGYIVASSEDLLKLFDADFGLLSINDETKVLGKMQASQEALALLEYLRVRRFTSVLTSQHVAKDFSDLRYAPGFTHLGGLLLVPLSGNGSDFIVFFRKWELKQVKWAGNPYEKVNKQGTAAALEPRKSFQIWSENVTGKSSEWTEDQIETAAVLCLVYGKFIEVWRQKEAALQTSQLTKILLANASHELRTPLNAIINFMEIALEGPLDNDTRENLSRSHSASKSLIYVINDLLDLTRTEEGHDLIKDEDFDLIDTVESAMAMFLDDVRRKMLTYEFNKPDQFPRLVKGDQGRIRQCLSNLISNAIKYTNQGGVTVDMSIVDNPLDGKIDVEIAIQDSGEGMTPEQMDILFRQLEQVHIEEEGSLMAGILKEEKSLTRNPTNQKMLGLGLAVVARIVQNMGGQLRLKSEKNKGSRFTLTLPFTLPADLVVTNKASQSPREVDSTNELTLVHRHSRPSLKTRNSRDDGSVRSHSSGSSHGNHRGEIDRLVHAIQSGATPGPQRSKSQGSIHSDCSTHSPSMMNIPNAAPWGKSSPGLPRTPLKEEEIWRLPPKFNAKSPNEVTSPTGSTHPKSTSPQKRPHLQSSEKTLLGAVPKPPLAFTNTKPPPPPSPPKVTAQSLNVLVAEDDPVNSLIIKKRMERMGYKVNLTVNGQQCANTFKAQRENFHLVLMDMQMPIMDGAESTATIRQIETEDPRPLVPNQLTQISPLGEHSRVPIFAVSATLRENKRLEYEGTGFDGWILKPVDFKRLEVLIKGINDKDIRRANAYVPGEWEKGGWFSPGDDTDLTPLANQERSNPISPDRQPAVPTEDDVETPKAEPPRTKVEAAAIVAGDEKPVVKDAAAAPSEGSSMSLDTASSDKQKDSHEVSQVEIPAGEGSTRQGGGGGGGGDDASGESRKS